MVTIEDLPGLWRRDLFKRPWRRADRSTSVHWLQAPRLFIDLRQPKDRPDFDGIHCLRQMGPQHVAWMAHQEGFAGHLVVEDGIAQWRRMIDFQPASATADRARIFFKGGVLREEGTEARYYEEWRRAEDAPQPCWGLRLAPERGGGSGFLARAGAHFMLARTRRRLVPPGGHLTQLLVLTPDLEDRQDLVDFEISLGRIDPETGRWRIERSTLPFKEGSIFRAIADPEEPDIIQVADLSHEGDPILRVWRIAEADHPSYRNCIAAWARLSPMEANAP